MKILQVIPSLNKGGAERLVLNLCKELSINNQVTLVTFRSDNEYAYLSKLIDHKVIPSILIPSLSGKAKVEVDVLQSFIDDYQPDVIHSHLFESEMVLSHINIGGAKRIVHFHDNQTTVCMLFCMVGNAEFS